MTKTEVAALALSAVAAMGSILAAVQANQAQSGLSALADRIAKVESAAPVAASRPAVVPANADLAREIAALKSQVAAMEARPAATATKPVVTPPADPAAAEEAAKKAKEAEEARQRVWLEGLSRRILESLTEHLQLTTQQAEQVREVLGTQLTEYRQARLGNTREETKKAIDDLIADTNAKLKPLFTQEQQAKYDEIANRPGGIFAIPGSTPGVHLNGGTTDVTPRK